MALPEAVTFEQFDAWYRDRRVSYWEPARKLISGLLSGLLDESLDERARPRVKVQDGRTKSAGRLWLKVHRDKYWSDVEDLDDIALAVDDIVGTRLVCLTPSDLLNAVDAIRQLPVYEAEGENRRPLYQMGGTEKDYGLDAKPSGYRAFHINLVVNVQHDSTFVPVECELQIRTLLQDSWGELTHEDTYKQGAPIPDLIFSMSRVMAEMLAVIDDLADEIASEIASIEEGQDANSDGAAGSAPVVATAAARSSDPLLAAVSAHLDERWRSLDAPLSLAALAHEIRQEFGQEASEDWFGLGFRNLVEQAVPGAIVNPAPPGYLLPPSAVGPSVVSSPNSGSPTQGNEVPATVESIRSIDRSYPALPHHQMSCLFEKLSDAFSSTRLHAKVDRRDVNLVTKTARDMAVSDGTAVGRNSFNYVANMLLRSRALDDRPRTEQGGIEISPSQIAELFMRQTLTLLGEGSRDDGPAVVEVGAWIGLA